MKLSKRNTPGFTLMEMMIALLVGGIVVTPLYIVTRSMAQGAENRRMDTEATQRTRLGLDYLLRDFRRAGLSVSPATGTRLSDGLPVDPMCDNSSITGSNAQYRKAVVHLNRGVGGFDAVLLTGNFASSSGKTYRGMTTGNTTFNLREDITEDECLHEFNALYSFAHITGLTNRYLDARIISTPTWTQTIDPPGTAPLGTCNGITVAGSDVLNNHVFGPSELVFITTNQTALYMVEAVSTPEGTRNDLVRYFVNYQNTSATAACALNGATNVSGVQLPGSSAVVGRTESTRLVIAQYVEDFQVWFRPVSVVGQHVVPHYLQPTTGAGVTGAGGAGGVFEDGFALSDTEYLFPPTNAALIAGTNHLSCNQPTAANIGPERLRSVMVRLAVRTEKTDPAIPFGAYGGTGRLVRYSLLPYSAGGGDAGVTTDKPGAAYRLKTMVTEVPMFNLASKAGLIPGLATARGQW
ncbi:MAG: prepilin-type N-terminal cleavage/methylation domain-containing protein [Deltaproteobacteria bacterium]|nr:prepilin-type N-terminal cleavage/methylation domain-containing protein [Deltaproteobacteria bacterium]